MATKKTTTSTAKKATTKRTTQTTRTTRAAQSKRSATKKATPTRTSKKTAAMPVKKTQTKATKASPSKHVQTTQPTSKPPKSANERITRTNEETKEPARRTLQTISKRRGPAPISDRERNAYLENLITIVSEETQRKHERVVKEAKYDLGMQQEETFRHPEIPTQYGLDRVILLVVEPRFVFSYWEVTEDSLAEAANHVGPHPKLTLRFYDTTGGTQPEQSPSWDIEVFDRLGNWYLRLEHPEQTLVIDVGLKDKAGRFCAITRSNYMKVPRDTIAPPGPIRWMVVGPNGEKVITDVEEYTDADLELLKRILGPHFYGLLMKGEFSSIVGSSMEAVFQNISSLKYAEMPPSSSSTLWRSSSTHE